MLGVYNGSDAWYDSYMNKFNNPSTLPATTKQLAFIRRLAAERQVPEGDAATSITVSNAMEHQPGLYESGAPLPLVTKTQASRAIDVMLKQPVVADAR